MRAYISPEYKAYLKSPEWMLKATAVKRRAGFRCECVRGGCHGIGRCRSRGPLQANHLHYRNIFHETLDDLEALCIPCHDRYTAANPRPTGPETPARAAASQVVVAPPDAMIAVILLVLAFFCFGIAFGIWLD